MTLDEKSWQKKLARKRKAQASRKTLPQHGNPLAPTQVAQRPIHDSLVASELFAHGIGLAALARRLPDGNIALAAFLVDIYCLGVKNAFYRVVSPEHWTQFLHHAPFEAIAPPCLRKLVEGAVAYARDLGLPAHADYARAAQLFGTIDAAECPRNYVYGQDGKPFYVSGPNETPAQSRRILNTLSRRLGADGFHYMAQVSAADLIGQIADDEPEQLGPR
ncbi:MAG: hypothetical protein V5B32_04310 [Candidatus Accumulibacter sp. UW26]|jgi:hypothetical protein